MGPQWDRSLRIDPVRQGIWVRPAGKRDDPLGQHKITSGQYCTIDHYYYHYCYYYHLFLFLHNICNM